MSAQPSAPAEQEATLGDKHEPTATGQALPEALLTPRDIERFWSKVDRRGPDECWPWMHGQHDFGYGQFWVNAVGRCLGAHRIVAFLAYGTDADRPCALHSCDNPPCCNPAHLRWGTFGENAAERDMRGRVAHGERQGLSKLTAATVRQMRAEYASGVLTPELGRRFGVHTATAWSAVTRKTWRHVV